MMQKIENGRVGRPRSFTDEDYLNAVKKLKTLSDSPISRELNVSRQTVNNFRRENKEIYEQAKIIIAELSESSYITRFDHYDMFMNIKIIQEWDEILRRRMVSPKKRQAYLRSFWHVCKHLKIHPSKIEVEDCAKLNQEMKELYFAGLDQPKGLAYSRIREAIRSFFMLVQQISGEYLTNAGIGKEALLGSGRYSKQKVSKEVRALFEEKLKNYVKSINEYLELLHIAKFMYYTGTRIEATLEFRFSNSTYLLEKDEWMFEIVDKGEHRSGRLKWDKYLIGHALDSFKEYCSKRFKIPIESLEKELPHKTDYLFPIFKNNYRKVRDVYKKALIESGIPYKQFPPTHIWRHTFAQDFLASSDWNFELCGSLGGWKSTLILKKHYGEMGKDPKLRGLKKAMQIPIKEVTYELRW